MRVINVTERRGAVLGEDRETVEHRGVRVTRPCALDEEVQNHRHRKPGEVHAIERVAKDGRNDGVYQCNVPWNQHRDEGTLGGRVDHFPICHAVEIGDVGRFGIACLDPRHLGRASRVFTLVAGWDVVRAR